MNAWGARKRVQRAALEAKVHARAERFREATRVSACYWLLATVAWDTADACTSTQSVQTCNCSC